MKSEETQQQPFRASFWIKAFLSYVYFIQGYYVKLGGTITLLYPVYPSLIVLSYFSMMYLPFSFKFVTAPLVQRFTFVKYGRRKFGIVVSLIITSLLTFPLAQNLTDPDKYLNLAIIFFIVILCISMGDIALDAACVKELENPVESSFIMMFYLTLGKITGGFILMKFIQPSNWFFFTT